LTNITRADGTPRALMELNCSSIRNNQMFFENIFLPYLRNNETNVLFDEAHALPNDLTQALLTICNTDPDPVRGFVFGGTEFIFDFSKISFVFATTEPDKLFPPLKDRLESVDFRTYTKEEISEMLDMYCADISIEHGAREAIVESIRDNPRSVVKRSEQINMYCQTHGTISFGRTDWNRLELQLDINPMGLDNMELIILSILLDRGACSLQTLSAVSGMSRTAIQRSAENRLMKCGLMDIDGKRRLTQKGADLALSLKRVDKLPQIF
jgi:Holliday junction resolvasome RuvABC ATP-dependent DNA helicase subunit